MEGDCGDLPQPRTLRSFRLWVPDSGARVRVGTSRQNYESEDPCGTHEMQDSDSSLFAGPTHCRQREHFLCDLLDDARGNCNSPHTAKSRGTSESASQRKRRKGRRSPRNRSAKWPPPRIRSPQIGSLVLMAVSVEGRLSILGTTLNPVDKSFRPSHLTDGSTGRAFFETQSESALLTCYLASDSI